MENNTAPTGRPLIKASTYKRNFRNNCKNRTYLCYEVDVWDSTWAPVEGLQGFLRNQSCVTLRLSPGGSPEWKRVEVLVHRRELEGSYHAELCFLDRVCSWHLDEGRQYRLTCYISWSPCLNCAQKLVEFLGENSHMSLRMCIAGIQTRFPGHEDGLRQLRDTGALLAIMTQDDLQHCWDTFVDKDNPRLWPRTEVEVHLGDQCQILDNILWSQGTEG